MVNFVMEIGARLRNVVPEYQRVVLGDINSHAFPQQKESAEWIRTFLRVHRRFNALHEETGRPMPAPKNIPDYRHTSQELRDVAALAQWLVGLHCLTESKKRGENIMPEQLSIREDDMVVREKIYG